MARRIALGAAGLFAVVLALLAGFALAMRLKFRPVQDLIRRVNRAVWNPRSMETAGQPGAPASVIHHTGRTSGTPYATPVGAVATEDGFVIPLPYGTNADWFRNVLAAGSATIEHEGETCEVDRPELVFGDEGNRYFPPNVQRSHRLFGVDDFLRLRRVAAGHDASGEPVRQ